MKTNEIKMLQGNIVKLPSQRPTLGPWTKRESPMEQHCVRVS
ncbi:MULTISPECIES: hypothetical protein [unclassified Roseateles]|nr:MULTISPECIES: hypothetical protein [unclassified Roseateles]